MNREKVIKNIKDGGSLIIYVGTASLMKPIISRDNDERSPMGKVGAAVSGTVISCGLAQFASNTFSKLVDEVAEFIDDIKKPKNKGVNQ